MIVAVGLSGGVDSSVAAALLKQQGHDVVGICMDTWPGGDIPIKKGRGCYGPRDKEIEKARAVANDLEIPFHVLDLKEEFRKIVIEYIRQEYTSGRTPNPCLRCNPLVKFGALLDKAKTAGIRFDRFATGHYAMVKFHPETGRYHLKKAVDSTKDQSYGLIFMSQEQLSRTMFPLGDVTKLEVRKIAKKLGLASSDAQESQDFYGGDISDLVEAEPRPGKILDTSGNVVGEHDGVWHFTVGQRRGLGVSAGEPVYVKAIDAESNVVTVGRKTDACSRGLIASRVNYVSVDKIEPGTAAEFRIRHTRNTIAGTVSPLPDGMLEIEFREPQWAVAPGQAVGIYSGDIVLAGGIIEKGI